MRLRERALEALIVHVGRRIKARVPAPRHIYLRLTVTPWPPFLRVSRIDFSKTIRVEHGASWQSMAQNARVMKQIAYETNTPIIMASQISAKK